MDVRWIAVIVWIFLLGTSGFMFIDSYEYEKFRVVDRNGTLVEEVYSSCDCVGFSLLQLDSYPPQFRCTGAEFCRSVNYTTESQSLEVLRE